MTLAIELLRESGMTVSQWESFLHQARQAGAADDSYSSSARSPRAIVTYAAWSPGQRAQFKAHTIS